MIVLIRNILFAVVFYTLSVPIVLSTPLSAAFGRRAMIRHASFWTRFHGWTVRWLLGIRIRVEGERPAGPVFYAAKHQSMWETLDLQSRLDGPAMVLKEELARLPFWGWSARQYGAIVVDREASAQAMRSMLRAATAAECREVLLEVRVDNTRAQRLYQRFGFEPIGVRRGYYQPGNVDALVMRLADPSRPTGPLTNPLTSTEEHDG